MKYLDSHFSERDFFWLLSRCPGGDGWPHVAHPIHLADHPKILDDRCDTCACDLRRDPDRFIPIPDERPAMTNEDKIVAALAHETGLSEDETRITLRCLTDALAKEDDAFHFDRLVTRRGDKVVATFRHPAHRAIKLEVPEEYWRALGQPTRMEFR